MKPQIIFPINAALLLVAVIAHAEHPCDCKNPPSCYEKVSPQQLSEDELGSFSAEDIYPGEEGGFVTRSGQAKLADILKVMGTICKRRTPPATAEKEDVNKIALGLIQELEYDLSNNSQKGHPVPDTESKYGSKCAKIWDGLSDLDEKNHGGLNRLIDIQSCKPNMGTFKKEDAPVATNKGASSASPRAKYLNCGESGVVCK